VSSRLSLNGGYAWLHATNLAPLVPRHKATYSAEIDLGRAFLHLGGMTVGSRYANSSRTTELAGYTVPTLKIMVPVRERLTLFGTLDNWIDEDYEVIAGYPMPGVNGAVGFEVRW
jgi:outer membrane cobalamin receptor